MLSLSKHEDRAHRASPGMTERALAVGRKSDSVAFRLNSVMARFIRAIHDAAGTMLGLVMDHPDEPGDDDA
jgi:hypothetical protein